MNWPPYRQFFLSLPSICNNDVDIEYEVDDTTYLVWYNDNWWLIIDNENKEDVTTYLVCASSTCILAVLARLEAATACLRRIIFWINISQIKKTYFIYLVKKTQDSFFKVPCPLYTQAYIPYLFVKFWYQEPRYI